MEILTALFGGLLRLAPDFMKWRDRKDERRHELLMQDKAIEFEKIRGAQRMDEIRAAGDAAATLAEWQGMIEATKAQAIQTGIKGIDAINALVRPFLTFWWAVVLATAAMVAQLYLLVTQSGLSPAEAILAVWGPFERGIVGTIIGFWFMDRVLKHQQR